MPYSRLLRLSVLLLLFGFISVGSRTAGAAAPALPIRPQGVHQWQPQVAALTYDLVYIRQPRKGDNEHIVWPEVFHPGRFEPGADLVLLHPDGSEEVLVVGGNGAVTDPFVSFDGQWVYYSFIPDARPESGESQRGYLPRSGADIYRINLQTRQTQQLTHQEFTPNTGAGNWDLTNPVDPADNFNRLGYGILNLGPAPIAGGKVVFTSNRNGFIPTKNFSSPNLQLFVMDEDGANVTLISPMTIGSTLHPTPLRDGRILFSSYESQGLRDERVWGIWAIWPDGRQWEPMLSAFKWANAMHFVTQLSNEDIVVEDYYNLNNFGFGALYRFPVQPPTGQSRFHSAFLSENPPIDQTLVFGNGPEIYPRYMSFTPRGFYSLSRFTNAEDEASPRINNQYVGKFTHPSAAPQNDLLVVWSPGPVNALTRPVNLPAPDAGLYLIPDGNPVNSPSELVLIKNDPNYNEVWPRAVVPYQAIHGVAQPVELPWLPNDGTVHPTLPAGSPYGLVGTSSQYKRESFPGHPGVNANDPYGGLDAFNTRQNDANSNWFTQGSDAGKYANSDIWAIRLLAMEPNTHRSYGPHEGQHFYNHINEKLRILGELPVRNLAANGNPILDAEGNPDTSFLAKIPADTPFTFQLLDRNGMVLTMAQTWHQVRPGEMRADCGGCHAHGQLPLDFAGTAASKPAYAVTDLSKSTPLLTQDGNGQPALRTVNSAVVNVEFYRDIRPLLQRSCVGCHTGTNPTPPGALVLDDTALYETATNSGQRVPGDYKRLCQDSAARWGYAPVIGREAGWRQTNASRYVRPFQSRRSLLIWKLFGQRLDGWRNGDHPTESIPGDASTLPPGSDDNLADLDYTGTIMPPPGSGVPPLTIDEKLTFVRWVDLACPINLDEGGEHADFGWFLDDVRPTLAVSAPRAGHNTAPLAALVVGVADANSGIKSGSLSIKADLAINGRPAGSELADLAQVTGDGIYRINLTTPLNNVTAAHLYAQVADNQGNITRVDQRFSVGAGGPTPTATPMPTLTATPTSFPCPTATPQPLWVEPVTSPTDELSQLVTVYIGDGERVTVTTASGVFTSVAAVNQHQLNISLLPNTTHNLTVTAKVKRHTGPGTCITGGYTLSTTRDRNGGALVIEQRSSASTGEIQGTVTNTDGELLAGARIIGYRQIGRRWVKNVTVRSDSTGGYQLPALLPGNYRLRFNKGGYQSEYYQDARNLQRATTLTLAGGATLTAIDGVLARANQGLAELDETGNNSETHTLTLNLALPAALQRSGSEPVLVTLSYQTAEGELLWADEIVDEGGIITSNNATYQFAVTPGKWSVAVEHADYGTLAGEIVTIGNGDAMTSLTWTTSSQIHLPLVTR